MNNKIAQITASAILLLITNSLPSNAVNADECLVADAITSSTVTNQVADNNIKPLVERKNPKPRLIEGKPTIPLLPIELPPQPQPRDCVKRVWHTIKRKWVYIEIKCGNQQPSRKQN
ncbi:MAG: hypothetical protein AAF915_15005 [Cyanobacteria bacterium P01_D01_bin.50]